MVFFQKPSFFSRPKNPWTLHGRGVGASRASPSGRPGDEANPLTDCEGSDQANMTYEFKWFSLVTTQFFCTY